MQSPDSFHARRTNSVWTKIHPLFALGQLGVFLVSLVLLGLYFVHVVPYADVHLSVLIKMAFMLGAIVTGSLWEHDVFGPWWFAQQYIIEDVMTMNVVLLHIAYLITYYRMPGNMPAILALLGVAYAVYGLNVGQYILNHMNSERNAAGRDRRPGVAA